MTDKAIKVDIDGPAIKAMMVLAQVRRLICEMTEMELLEYRRRVRKEAGYSDDGGKIQ